MTQISDMYEVFGLGWFGAFDQEGEGPRSQQWILTRMMIDGDISCLSLCLYGGDMLSMSPETARRFAHAVLAALDTNAKPPHSSREITDGGPDRWGIACQSRDGTIHKMVTGYLFGGHVGVRRNDDGRWAVDHTPTGYRFITLDSYAQASALAEKLAAECDLSTADADAVVKQQRAKALVIAARDACAAEQT